MTEEAGFMEPEGMERTWKFNQKTLAQHVDLNTQRKMMDLRLDFGPYALDFTKNGR
jgi:U3 small nucleolar RNA-associated protein 7